MSSPESNFSLTTKVFGDLLTVRGDDWTTFRKNLDDAEFGAQRIAEFVGTIHALGNVVPLVNTDAAPSAPPQAPTNTWEQQGPPPAWTQPTPPPPAQQGQGAGSIEMVNDRYGNTWTYNRPDAPALPDGRGLYAHKSGLSKENKRYEGWFDPAKGPKPFPKGSVEAPAIWPKRG